MILERLPELRGKNDGAVSTVRVTVIIYFT